MKKQTKRVLKIKYKNTHKTPKPQKNQKKLKFTKINNTLSSSPQS